MPDLDLVFDFDGWKLNDVYIFSKVAAFTFLGAEDTPPTETLLQPGLLERVKAGLTGHKAQAKRRISDDEALVYGSLGLRLEYEEDFVYYFVISLKADQDSNTSPFPGRFVFGADAVDLSTNSTPQNIKDIFGEPDDSDLDDSDGWAYMIYNINNYELEFGFDENQKLETIEGSTDNIFDKTDTANPKTRAS